MEFDEQEEHEEEEMGMEEPPQAAAAPSSYNSLGNTAARSKIGGGEGRKSAFGAAAVRYRECQKNHAVSFGGHAVDGCCEFMAAGEDGTLEAVICAACNCHRNFHRKEIDGEMSSFHHRQPPTPPPLHQFSPYYQHHRVPSHHPAGYLHHHHLATLPMAQHRPLALPAAASGGGLSRDEDDVSNPSSGGGGGGGGSKKRFRTKFTPEQKDKMLAFAEQLGWRIQKHDESAVEQFCAENNVKRNVLKVWMHNNKITLGKKP